MVTEIVSWWLISNFTHSYFHLWIFVTLLQTAFIISLTIFCIKSFSVRQTFDNKLLLLISLILFLTFNPFTLLLSSSAMRQGVGALFFVISLHFLFKRYWWFGLIFALISVFSHNSFILFYAAIFALNIFRFINLELKFILVCVILIILVTLFVPRAELVTNSNRALYLTSNILALIFALFKGDHKVKIIVYSLVAVPIGFFLDLSYFDRFSLLTSAIVWPVLIAAYYQPIRQKLLYPLLFIAPAAVFLRSISRFETGW